jgi:hypothetical protein
MRKLFTLLAVAVACVGLAPAGQAQVQVSAGGPPTPYTSLRAAFLAINAGTHTGAILVEITGNTSESAQPTLNASGTGAASYTSVTIQPTVVASITATYADSAVIRLLGADNVTINGAINGSGTSRDLSIIHNGASDGASAIWLSSPSTTDGCVNVTVRNCVLRGGSETSGNSAGVRATGTANTVTSAGSLHNNLQVINNKIERCNQGVVLYGSSTAPSTGFLVQGNDIGNPTVGMRVRQMGVYAFYATAAVIEGNYIHDLTVAPSTSVHAIQIGGSNAVSKNCVVRNNNIQEVRNPNTGGWGAYGVNIAAGDSIQVYNNFIAGISTMNYSSTSTLYNPFGIRIAAGVGHLIVYNSVYMNGDHNVSTVAPIGAALLVTPTTVSSVIRNNVLANNSTGTIAGSKFYAIWFSTAGASLVGSTINNNAYMVPAAATPTTSYFVGRIGSTDYANLAAWAGYTGQDGASVPPTNGQPLGFTSATDLHIPAATPSFYESNASPIAGITTDYDGDVRNATTPDIGADEFAGLPVGDFAGPALTNVVATPAGNQCNPTARTISVDATDPSGVASVVIRYTVNGGAPVDVPMTLGAAPTYTGTLPAQAAGATVSWSLVATDASAGANVTNQAGGSYTDAYLNINIVGPSNPVCLSTNYTYIAASAADPLVRITELVHFRTGTGATSPYPAYATGSDLVELTNFSPVTVNLSGFVFENLGVAPRTYTFPATAIIPSGGVLVLHLGTGTDDPTNLYFNAGGSNDGILSTSAVGYVLRSPGGVGVVDAVGVNGYTFLPASGVTTADWNGTVNGSAAGFRLMGTDNNFGSDWAAASATNVMNVGTPNAGAGLGAVGGSGVTFTWSPSGASGASFSQAFTADTELIVTATDGNCSQNDTLNVVVNPGSAAPTAVNDTVCPNAPATLSATASGPITWYSDPAGLTQVGTGATFNTSVATTTTYYVRFFDGSCLSAIGQATVQVENTPLNLTASNDTTVCLAPGGTVSLSANATGGGTVLGVTYDWSNGLPTGSAISFTPLAGTHTYTVTATDACGTSASESVTLTVAQAISAVAAAGSPVCAGNSTMLMAQATGGSGALTYTWNNGAGTGDMVPVSPTATTVYTVTVTDAGGVCSATASTTVEVLAAPVAAFSANANGLQVSFTNTSQDATSYTWNFGDGSPSSNATSPQHTYTAPGVYTVTLVASNGCGADVVTQTVGAVGVANTLAAGQVAAYPNPVANGDALHVDLSGVAAPTAQLHVLNATGQVVAAHTVDLAAGAAHTTLPTTGLAAGLYTLRVATAQGVWHTKVVVR